MVKWGFMQALIGPSVQQIHGPSQKGQSHPTPQSQPCTPNSHITPTPYQFPGTLVCQAHF